MHAIASYAETVRPPRTLTEREQMLLLEVTGEHRAGCRDHCPYAPALGTGLREHELIALDVGGVFRNGRPRRRLLLSVFEGAERTDVQEVLLSESLRGKLRRFHGWKVREREPLPADALLFISRLGQRFSLRQVRHGFTVWQVQAGFEQRVTFPMLRHTACSNLDALGQPREIRDPRGLHVPPRHAGAHALRAQRGRGRDAEALPRHYEKGGR